MSSNSSSGSKGKKKNCDYFNGKKNIVTAELYDDLQDKIEQVKKVVRNRSKMDIALVLRSCEQADNAVDAAIAKLIGPDRGRECLQEWATQPKKTKAKPHQQGVVGKSFSKSDGGSSPECSESQNNSTTKHTTNQNIESSVHQKSVDDVSMNVPLVNSEEVGNELVSSSSSASTGQSPNKAIVGGDKRCGSSAGTGQSANKGIVGGDKGCGEGERKGRSRERRSRANKKKPRPPKRIRDKLKQLVPPENKNESAFDDTAIKPHPQTPPIESTSLTDQDVSPDDLTNTEATNTTDTDPIGDGSNTTSPDTTSTSTQEPAVAHSTSCTRPTQLNTTSTSSIESGICSSDNCSSCDSVIGTGTDSPLDNCTPDRERPLTLRPDTFTAETSKHDNTSPSQSNAPGQHDASLKKLLKDLHRCDVSLSRYQGILNEQCDNAINELQKVFTILRIGLRTREEDIFNDIQFIRQTAGHILHRRKITCMSLKKLSESTNHLDENQVQELKKQLKQFITERRIDEELGLNRRFAADPDDLLPSIMKFGKTLGVQACYCSWNEFPGEALGRVGGATASKPPLLMTPLIKNAPPIPLPPMIPFPPPPPLLHGPPPPPPPPLIPPPPSHPGFDIPFPIPSHAILNKQTVFNKIPILPTPPIPPAVLNQPRPPPHPLPPSPKDTPSVEYINDEFGKRRKYSPEELAEIQERVKESLKAQGVCLYSPFTGEAMKSELQKPQPQITPPVKKTPTQQRKERKRRQKERERRQRELEKNSQKAKKSNEKPAAVETAVSEKIASSAVSNKVGKPASVSIIKSAYRPWWSRRSYSRHPPPTITRRPHLSSQPSRHAKSISQKIENSSKKDVKKDSERS